MREKLPVAVVLCAMTALISACQSAQPKTSDDATKSDHTQTKVADEAPPQPAFRQGLSTWPGGAWNLNVAKTPAQLKKEQEDQAKAAADFAIASAAAKPAGEKFLAENAKKEGWTTTASGLQYHIIAAGEGVHPVATDTIKAHYEGHLVDGKEFDSSYKRGEPLEVALNAVIPAWTEALQLIGKGGKIEFAAPYKLNYGEAGHPAGIPGCSVLCFTAELLEIKKAAEQPLDAAKDSVAN